MNHETFICKRCPYPVVRQVFGSEPGQHEEWWACLNPEETHYWGTPRREKDWEYNDQQAEYPGLEPWPEETPLSLTVAMQNRCLTASQMTSYVKVGAPAVAIAFSLLMAILIPLSAGTAKAFAVSRLMI
jgi:hypothetical protein